MLRSGVQMPSLFFSIQTSSVISSVYKDQVKHQYTNFKSNVKMDATECEAAMYEALETERAKILVDSVNKVGGPTV